ncbi:MAG: TIGR03619 family F420-dependent LLM class oxidoreductase [Actinomycetota bacterium]|nr:TIGR03619 family F420-dependent LLM class oxidoreductase [Actinomycetota bacterium]
MSIGVIIPNSGAVASRLHPVDMARVAESAGAEGLWLSDHLLMVDTPVDYYPYSDDGRLTWDVADDYLETLVCCAALAAATRTAVVGPAVLILPQRNVLQVAKEATTIDRLSNGRFILGVGSGWNIPEMEALGYPFKGRTRRFEEQLEVLADAWSGRPGAFDGEQVRIPSDIVLHPTPANGREVPLLVGGMAAPALRRAARAGGWMAISAAHAWDSGAMSASLQAYSHWCTELGTTARPVLKLHSDVNSQHRVVDVVRDAIERMGFIHVIVDPPWATSTDAAAEMIATLSEFFSGEPLTRYWR